MDYDVWFIVRNGSVGLHLLTCFNWFWYIVIALMVYYYYSLLCRTLTTIHLKLTMF